MIAGHHGESFIATVEVVGDARARALMDAVMKHPFLDDAGCFRNVKSIVISLIGSESLSMDEVQEFVEHIKEIAPEAQLALGLHIDESLVNCVGAMLMFPYPHTVLIENKSDSMKEKSLPVNRLSRRANKDLLLCDDVGLKFDQQQLPLVSVSKGRFDKGEPNLHDGKDLDVPTFLRRNIILI